MEQCDIDDIDNETWIYLCKLVKKKHFEGVTFPI